MVYDPSSRVTLPTRSTPSTTTCTPGMPALLYLVMELVVGVPLETVITSGPLPARRVVDIGIQVCRALQFAHDVTFYFLFRDVRPPEEQPQGVIVKTT